MQLKAQQCLLAEGGLRLPTTYLFDDHGVPQRARLLQLLHKLLHVRLEVREGGHLQPRGQV